MKYLFSAFCPNPPSPPLPPPPPPTTTTTITASPITTAIPPSFNATVGGKRTSHFYYNSLKLKVYVSIFLWSLTSVSNFRIVCDRTSFNRLEVVINIRRPEWILCEPKGCHVQQSLATNLDCPLRSSRFARPTGQLQVSHFLYEV